MSMKISKSFRFEASHILPLHPGKCSRLHGHSWLLGVAVEGPINKETGFVLDYAELKAAVQPIVDRFDHQHLNAFVRYPSSENIAVHVAHELRCKLMFDRLVVTVSETEGTLATWDSADIECQKIFIEDSLDSAPLAMDAGWRSPSFVKPDDSRNGHLAVMNDENVVEYAALVFDYWSHAYAELMQRRLYRESLGKPGAIREELAPFIQNEKA